MFICFKAEIAFLRNYLNEITIHAEKYLVINMFITSMFIRKIGKKTLNTR